jgi:hypothetical protein
MKFLYQHRKIKKRRGHVHSILKNSIHVLPLFVENISNDYAAQKPSKIKLINSIEFETRREMKINIRVKNYRDSLSDNPITH